MFEGGTNNVKTMATLNESAMNVISRNRDCYYELVLVKKLLEVNKT